MRPERPQASPTAPRDIAKNVLEIESAAIAALAERIDGRFDEAVRLLLGCSGRVVVSGMGKSGLICQKISATLASTGTPAFFLHPSEALHGDLGMIVEGDVLIALSNSGETDEVIRLLELVRRLGSKIVTLTGNPESTLARHADVHLDVAVSEEACALDLVPTASTSAALAMGDALAVACYQTRGFSAQDFARFHPGGSLGRKLLQVQAIMHRGEETPVIDADAPLKQAIREISRKKLGMTCVVDREGALVGVLTDGDLRRRLLEHGDPLEGPVTDAMTRTPRTIRADALASEALRLLEQCKITSLPVVDESGSLVGVVQIHDLWRTELF